MQLLDANDVWQIIQGLGLVLSVLGLGAATIRSWWRRRRSGAPKLPGDTFSVDTKTAPDPEVVALRAEVAGLRGTVTAVQGQLTTAIEQNRRILQRQGELDTQNGAYRRRVRQLEDAWPDNIAKPAIDPEDASIIRSIVNEDTIPRGRPS